MRDVQSVAHRASRVVHFSNSLGKTATAVKTFRAIEHSSEFKVEAPNGAFPRPFDRPYYCIAGLRRRLLIICHFLQFADFVAIFITLVSLITH